MLLVNSYAIYHFMLKNKRCDVHPYYDLREMYREFRYLYWQLPNHPERFFELILITCYLSFVAPALTCLAVPEHIPVMLKPSG